MSKLTPTQAEILKLFKSHRSERDLQELKEVLSKYLADKLVYEADTEFRKRNYTVRDIERWKTEHRSVKES
jgi:hypothetical protein